MNRVLVTGADGFVGRALCSFLEAQGHDVVWATRRNTNVGSVNLAGRGVRKSVAVGDIGRSTEWGKALEGVTDVVHLAASVHVLRKEATGLPNIYRLTNVEGTERLARMAAQFGARRFVFLSSIKVNGDQTYKGVPFREADQPQPSGPYAMSKWEAEQRLFAVASETGLDVVILRPPLVYGAGVRANFLRLVQWIDRGFPLPFGLVSNRRSLLYVGNLVNAIAACLFSSRGGGKVFLVSDGEDISTPDLIRLISRELGKKPVLFPVPVLPLHGLGALVGKREEMARLLGSLEVDSSRIRQEMDWTPPYSLREGIEETVRWFRTIHEK